MSFVRGRFSTADRSLVTALVMLSIFGAATWMVDTVWNDAQNLQFLVPMLMSVYSLTVVIPLAVVVLLTRRKRASSSTAERRINLIVVVAAIGGSAAWTFALIDHVRHLIVIA